MRFVSIIALALAASTPAISSAAPVRPGTAVVRKAPVAPTVLAGLIAGLSIFALVRIVDKSDRPVSPR